MLRQLRLPLNLLKEQAGPIAGFTPNHSPFMSVKAMFRFLLFCGLLTLLQSCQHSMEAKRQKAENVQKLSDAASFNVQLGMGYLKQGDRPRAKRKLLTALELAPDSPDVNVAMAYFLEKTGDMEEARIYYKKALSLAPNSGAQLNNFGTFLCRAGKYKEAESYFLKAVSDVHYVHSAGAYENAGLCATAVPDYAKAEIYFSKALEQDPERKQSLLEITTIALKQNQPDKALKYLQKYQELSLNDPVLLSLAADAATKLGKTEVAADYQARLNKLTRNTDYAGDKNEFDSANG
ncbi:type IV pilus biogenesis/stability protein PilW [Legionella erythra]|uniref:type IV pilus biogenesis/stability protein PilW n=1 Tax=Legionella erythra TaxID=448 RepID=UPI001ED98915|nr:type IV pilus biogenesis/stability protein PilW [Legionella erythra]